VNSMTSNKQRKKKTYDIIVVGGGIAGLYSVLLLQKYNPSLKIGLFEKEKRLGGRICSHKFDNDVVVAKGAGRFHSGHHRLLALLNELGIATKNTNSGHCTYYSAIDGKESIDVQMGGDTFLQTSTSPSWYPPLNTLFEIYMEHPIIKQLKKNTEEMETEQTPAYSIFWKIAGYSVLEEDAVLKKTTIYDYASSKKLISAEELKLFVNSFGFTDEIMKMNAYNAIRMIFGMIADVFQYMTVDGVELGLESIIVSLVEKLKDGFDDDGCFDVFLEEEIKQIKFDETNSLFQVSQHYFAKKCIIALPKQSAITLPILEPIKKLLETIGTTPLCRIYCQFPKNKDGKVWFSGLTKGNLSNMLRCIIPINEEKGIIMVSYSDAKYAEKWNELYQNKKEGKKSVEDLIVKLLQKSFPHLNIPKPEITEVFFWKDGVGYWMPNTDSKITSYGIVNPMKNLFVCSETYSEDYQQWIEGALETSADVVLQIMNDELELLPDDDNAEYDEYNNLQQNDAEYDEENYYEENDKDNNLQQNDEDDDAEYDEENYYEENDKDNNLQQNDEDDDDAEYNDDNNLPQNNGNNNLQQNDEEDYDEEDYKDDDLQLTDIEEDEEDKNE